MRAEDFPARRLREEVFQVGLPGQFLHLDLSHTVEMLLNHQHLTIQDAEVVDAALAQYRANARMSFSDCLVLEVARKAMRDYRAALSKLGRE